MNNEGLDAITSLNGLMVRYSHPTGDAITSKKLQAQSNPYKNWVNILLLQNTYIIICILGEPVYHGFYQWIGMILFGQSIIFYVPHFLWKSCEGKRIERLVSGLKNKIIPTNSYAFTDHFN